LAGGYRNTGEAAPAVASTAPEATAAAAREAAAKEEAEINRHPYAEIEEAHASFASEVPTQDAINLLVKAHRGQQPTEADINRIAEAMNVSPNVATARLRAMNTGIEGQFSTLARAHGVNPDAAADWIRTRRSSEALSAVRDHVLGRTLRAWEPPIKAYMAAGGQ